jgi:hypothetical protein
LRIPTARPFAALMVTTDHGTRGGTGRDTAMKHRRWVLAGAGVLALGVGALAVGTAWAMSCCGETPAATAGTAAPGAPEASATVTVVADAHAAHIGNLKAAIAAVDAAAKAVESGDKAAAASELAKARKLLASIEAATDKPAGGAGGFANAKCPIMGSPISPAKVTPDLVRVYNGKKIGFCCAGCPARWDKLTDAEKEARLR